ncbi:ABC transporter substrate-binding protein [Ramlibacter sp. WS9]|uniref:ABC transporter substrate-binding protein n=1 Tax=Ramlibacter sp. WS9 TaxID=1882741 RepID=UPI001305142F|nr:ABC transporter substrate-binding protein [Ramlibacter sp. WS9]
MAFLAACALAALLLPTGARSQSAPGVTADKITVGQTIAMSGPFGDIARELLKGSQAYFNVLNRTGGIHGRQVELVSKDDGYITARALDNAKQFIDSQSVFCLFSNFGTPTNEAILPLAESSGTPLFASFTGALSLRSKDLKSTMNIRASYADEAEHLVKQLHTLGVRKIAVVYQNNTLGQEILQGVSDSLGKRGIKPVWTGAIEPDSSNAEAMAAKAMGAKPEVLILGIAGKSTIEVIKAVKGANAGIQLYALSILATPANLRALGKLGRGVVVSQVVPLPTSPTMSLAREYRAAMTEAGHTDFTHLSFEGYINGRILAEGLKRAGRNLTRPGFISALHTLQRYDAGGLMVSFGRGAASSSSFVELTMIDSDGKLIK